MWKSNFLEQIMLGVKLGITLAIITVLFTLVETLGSQQSPSMAGTVVERVYTPPPSSIVPNYELLESEKWTVIVNVNGDIVPVQVDDKLWIEAIPGKQVNVANLRGRLTGWIFQWVLLS